MLLLITRFLHAAAYRAYYRAAGSMSERAWDSIFTAIMAQEIVLELDIAEGD